MEGARVGIFEDNERVQRLVTQLVTEDGHSVVTQAMTMEEARAVIDELPEDALDVAIVDGNLTPGQISGQEGAEITRLLRDKFSNVVVIGFTATEDIEGADHQLKKPNDFLNILGIITGL